ncbi:MAG: hypothetical protein WKF77_12935 [Planctomycetaceae bacterium]
MIPQTLVAQLYKSLTAEQKKLMAFDFEHKDGVWDVWQIEGPSTSGTRGNHDVHTWVHIRKPG